MRKISTKIISIVLAVIICFATCVSAFAETEVKYERDCPKIFVNGFMASAVYIDPSNPDSEMAWPPSQDAILGAVKDAILPIGALMIDGNWSKFGKSVASIVDKLFAPACSDYNGEVTNGSGVRFEYPAAEEIKSDSEVEFVYDWRLDPTVIASQLNDFVNYVLESSNSQKVTIHCHSLGGVVTSTYLKLYGNEKVKSVVFNTTAIYGETYTGELFKGQISLNADAIKYFLDYAFDDSQYENTLSLVFEMLNEAGVLQFVCDLGDKLVENIYDDVMLSVVRLFANWPTVWAMVPDSDMKDAEEYVFGNIYKKAGVDFTGLKNKVEKYNTDVRQYKTETLKNLAKTTNVYVISRYGYSSLPITPSWDVLGDGVIDTKYNSFGATTSSFGKTLDVVPDEYVSPDKTVDASTCLFPEQTWFIRNIKHSDMPDCVDILVEMLLYNETLANVNTFEEYPRFLEYDAQNDKLLIDQAETPITFIQKLWLAILEIFNAIKSLFVNIGK